MSASTTLPARAVEILALLILAGELGMEVKDVADKTSLSIGRAQELLRVLRNAGEANNDSPCGGRGARWYTKQYFERKQLERQAARAKVSAAVAEARRREERKQAQAKALERWADAWAAKPVCLARVDARTAPPITHRSMPFSVFTLAHDHTTPAGTPA
jgi:hypothetical protein